MRDRDSNRITNTLQWSQHIKLISSKVNRTLDLIRRVCRDITDPDTKKVLYCSIVRPQLEYACELWSPYTSKDKLLLENVQRRATKFILNYPRDMSYRDRLVKLSLLPLEYRREMKNVVLIYNARAGHIDLGHQYFFCQNVVRQKTRNSSELNYKIPHAKQNYLKHLSKWRGCNLIKLILTRTTTWNLPGPSGTQDCINIVKLSHPSPVFCGG